MSPGLKGIDIHLEVPRVNYDKLSSDWLGEPSSAIRERVQAARQRQLERFSGKVLSVTPIGTAQYTRGRGAQILQTGRGWGPSCPCGDIVLCMSQLNLSAQAYHRTLKLARTIADLAGSEHIQTPHVAEALQYRPKSIVG